MHPTALCVFLGGLAFPSLGFADERPPGTVAVASSLFRAPGQPDRHPDGVPPAEVADWMQVVVDLTEMEWLVAVRDADPLLAPYRPGLSVKRLPEPPVEVFADPGVPEAFGNRASVPDALVVEGLEVQTRLDSTAERQFRFQPVGSEPDFQMTCLDLRDTEMASFAICTLLVTYPPDPDITLSAGFYGKPFQELGPDLPAIAARMREIALCLDVTDAPPADPGAALAALLAAHPRLSGCEAKLFS